ncbi:serine/threonine-protein kinase [Amycolatopsis sp. cmx-11-32]|uniref:serine/threonine-protein kinase n=1 Tax=Amycolatopsis sp. cmx-11-32 TaxID=2785796 RepID=UPI0039E5AD9A
MTAVSRTIAGRYTLLEELGRDGTAVLWRAEDESNGRQVALRALPSAAAFEQLRREALVALNHPSATTVHDVAEAEDGAAFLVTELPEGRPLRDLGTLSPSALAGIGGQVLGALEAAHTAGIVHGDVRPANILVRQDGTVKLTGFGLDPTGSPAFLAPERIAGHEATPHSDLWSLGVTLLSVSEGGNPFHRENFAATLYAVINDEPRPVRTHGPLAALIKGLLAKSPRARMLPDQARPLLARVTDHPVPVLPVPPRPAPGLTMPSVFAILAGVAGMLLGFFLLGDAMLIHRVYYLFDLLYPPLLIARVGIVLAGVLSVAGGALLLARVRPGQVMISVSAGLTLLSVLLLNATDDEQEYFARALQPGLTLDLVALASVVVLTLAVWFVPARRPAVG